MSSKKKLENLLDVFRNYIRQETVEPVKSLFGSVLFLFVGSLFVSIGFILVSIGVVGFFQRFEAMDLWFSWVPYLCGSLFLLVAVFLSIKFLFVKKKNKERFGIYTRRLLLLVATKQQRHFRYSIEIRTTQAIQFSICLHCLIKLLN